MHNSSLSSQWSFVFLGVDNLKKESPSTGSAQAGLPASNLLGYLANFFLFWNEENEMQE